MMQVVEPEPETKPAAKFTSTPVKVNDVKEVISKKPISLSCKFDSVAQP